MGQAVPLPRHHHHQSIITTTLLHGHARHQDITTTARLLLPGHHRITTITPAPGARRQRRLLISYLAAHDSQAVGLHTDTEAQEAQGDLEDIMEGPADLGDTTGVLVGRAGREGIMGVLGKGLGREEGIEGRRKDACIIKIPG